MARATPPPHLLVPPSLPILPLSPNTILFPSLVISIPITRRDSLSLLSSVLRDAENAPLGLDGRRNLPIVGCVPLRNEEGAAKDDGDDEASDLSNASSKLQVIRLPDKRIRGGLPASENNADETSSRPEVTPGSQDGEPPLRPSAETMFDWGCAGRILRVERLAGGGYSVTLQGLSRIRIDRFTQVGFPHFEAEVSVFAEQGLPRAAASLLTQLRESSQALLSMISGLSLPPVVQRRIKAFISGVTLSGAGTLADIMIATIETPWADKLDILATPNVADRVKKSFELLQHQKEVVDVTRKIGEKVSKNLSRQQRQFFLRQQLDAIRQELAELEGNASAKQGGDFLKRMGGSSIANGDSEEGQDEMKELETKIEAAGMPPEALHVTIREYKRLQRIPTQSVEHGVVLNYLNTLVELPWSRGTSNEAFLNRQFVKHAREQLDADHYGMEKVKKRLLEYLAVLRLRGEKEAKERAVTVADDSETKGLLPESKVGDLLQMEKHDVAEHDLPVPLPKLPSKHVENEKPRTLNKAPILCLVGPPGVGKTSIAKSLATSMGRKFHRISLGGVRDEAEIRGHRRTYVGAMPGLIAQCLRRVGVNNPVILLDEIDKISSNSIQGDPAAALLEVLDPEQNWTFSDHYINTPIDLSTVLFIATANTLDTISAPLLDRMEVIELSGYVYDEKLAIVKKYLLPKQIEANVLEPGMVEMSDEVMIKLITSYTREAGVRTLEREVGSVCRAKAVEFSEIKHESSKPYDARVTLEDLERILGSQKYESEVTDKLLRPGIVTGLAYQGSGNGGILYIEASTSPGTGLVKLTGSLGEVISESAQLAISWVKSHAWQLALTANRNDNVLQHLDLHIHFPSGSIKKDGPSAGVALVCCIVSLLSGQSTSSHLAMTGEITLRGQVSAVGGIREKVLAAHRCGIQHVILPVRNRKDVQQDLSVSVKEDVKFSFVQNIHEALHIVFGDTLYDSLDLRGWQGKEERRRGLEMVESRL